MEMKDLLGILRRFRVLVIAVIAFALLVGIAAAYLPRERYQATATLVVTPASKQIDFSSVDVVQFLLPSLAAQVGTHTFAVEVRTRLGHSVSWNGVSLSANDEPGTSILHVTAETYSPETAALVANAAAKNLSLRRVFKLADIQLLDPARPPSSPSSPNRPLIIFSALVLGLIGSVLTAVAANAIRPRLRTASEIRERLGLDVIGEIPYARRFPKQPSRLFDPASGHTVLMDAYQRLSTNFEIVASGHPVVGVTSCTAGEGKSAVTANLAWALASMGQQVVAVDVDLRRPQLHEYFAVPLDRGVAGIRRGQDIEILARPTRLPTLRIVPAGYATQNPTGILHASYARILETFADSLVLVDMPPMLGTADAGLVARMTKTIVLVSDARHGDPDEIKDVLRDLGRVGCDVLGVVLNRASVKRSPRTALYYAEATRWAPQMPESPPVQGRVAENRPRSPRA